METSELTDWFPDLVMPIRPGVYEVRGGLYGASAWYAFWDGNYWRSACTNKDVASVQVGVSFYQSREWRGLNHSPAR